MIDNSCHVIISCYVIVVVLKILVICFIPYELDFSVFFFLFRFFGWAAVLQQKGGRANTVSTHAAPTLHQPFRRLSRRGGNHLLIGKGFVLV